MIIDKNAPYNPCVSLETRQSAEYDGFYTVEENNRGIPIRLEIASRLLVAMVSASSISSERACTEALKLADQLIDAHNKSCEGEK